MKHITTDKGDIGVAKVISDTLQKGLTVFNPISASCPFDLLIFNGNRYLRVQVKYRTPENGSLSVNLRRAITVGSKAKYTGNNYVDVLAIYCPTTDKCYYFSRDVFLRSISVRIDPPKTKQKKKIRFAKEFIEFPKC